MSASKRGEGGVLFGLVWRIMLLGENRSKKQLNCVDLIINYFKKRRVRGFDRE